MPDILLSGTLPCWCRLGDIITPSYACPPIGRPSPLSFPLNLLPCGPHCRCEPPRVLFLEPLDSRLFYLLIPPFHNFLTMYFNQAMPILVFYLLSHRAIGSSLHWKTLRTRYDFAQTSRCLASLEALISWPWIDFPQTMRQQTLKHPHEG
jgi:hypothetical protein